MAVAAAPGAPGAQFISGVCHRPRRLGQRISGKRGLADDLAPLVDEPPSGGGRSSVTLKQLVQAGLLAAPGSGVVSCSYKGETWRADLAADGTIEFEGKRYTSPTAFSVHCKRKITPGKQADDGWVSVQYHDGSGWQPLGVLRSQYQGGGGGRPAAPQPCGGGAPAAAKPPRPARSGSKRGKRKRQGSAGSVSEDGGGGGEDEGALLDELEWEEQAAQQAYLEQLYAQQAAAAQLGSPLTVGGQLVVDLPPDAEVEGADRWVQCERCEVWRLVPQQNWQAVQDDPREEWFYEYAQWDVASQPPHKPACTKGR